MKNKLSKLNPNNSSVETLIKAYKPLIVYIVNMIFKRSKNFVYDYDHDDLIQEGMIGLMDAIKKYDKHVHRFKTYASIRITGSIKDAMRKYGNISRTDLYLNKKIMGYINSYKQLSGTTPASQLIRKDLNLTVDKYQKWAITRSNDQQSIRVNYNIKSIPKSFKKIFKERTTSFLTPEIRYLALEQLQNSFNFLTDKRVILIFKNYYIDYLTLNQIGKKLGISESRVSQIIKINKMKMLEENINQ